jgi:hypothetical protein
MAAFDLTLDLFDNHRLYWPRWQATNYPNSSPMLLTQGKHLASRIRSGTRVYTCTKTVAVGVPYSAALLRGIPRNPGHFSSKINSW